MKKPFVSSVVVFLVALLSANFSAWSATLSKEQAFQRAISSAGDKATHSIRARMASSAPECVLTLDAVLDGEHTPALYVFSATDASSFLIAGADDRIRPLLAYSDESGFDPATIPPQMKWWLGEYVREINYALARPTSDNLLRINASDADHLATVPQAAPFDGFRRTSARFAPIEPLVSSKWDQGSPYNNSCPTIKTKRCYTGCVATAMAQVMNYHNWPLKGKGSHSYTTWTSKLSVSFDYEATTFDWANMRDTYNNLSSNDSKNAVATLMLAAGVSVDMDYGTESSGAQSSAVRAGMIEYLDYTENTLYYTRAGISNSQWDALVYGALEAGFPVLYTGAGAGGGHAFVCDGYNDAGLFHINWGWGGYQDGYFALNALDPDGLGTGGGTGGGFNYYQDITVAVPPHVDPYVPDPSIKSAPLYSNSLSVTNETTNPTLNFNIINSTTGTVRFDVGYKVLDQNLNVAYSLSNQWSGELGQSTYYPEVTTDIGSSKWATLDDGTYYFFPTYMVWGTSEAKKLPQEHGNDVCVVVKEGNKLSASLGTLPGEEPDPEPEPSGSASMQLLRVWPTTLIRGLQEEFDILVENVGDGAFSAPLHLFIGVVKDNTLECHLILDFDQDTNIAPGKQKSFYATGTYSGEPDALQAYLGTDNGKEYLFLDYNPIDIAVTEYEAHLLYTDGFPANIIAGQDVRVPDGFATFAYRSAKMLTTNPTVTIIDSNGVTESEFHCDAVNYSPSPDRGTTTNVPGFTFTCPELPGKYTAVYSTGLDCNPISMEFTVTEKAADTVPLTMLSVTSSQDVVRAGDNVVLTVTPVPADATDYDASRLVFDTTSESLTVSDHGIVNIDPRPQLGPAEIIIKAEGTSVAVSYELTIEATPVSAIRIIAPATSAVAPATLTFTAEVQPDLATDPTVEWSTEYEDATISSEGVLTIGDNAPSGTLEVKATAADGSKISASVMIEVTEASGIVSAGIDSSVEIVDNSVKVTAPAGTICTLSTTDGRTVITAVSEGTPVMLSPEAHGVYILSLGAPVNRSFKLRL